VPKVPEGLFKAVFTQHLVGEAETVQPLV